MGRVVAMLVSTGTRPRVSAVRAAWFWFVPMHALLTGLSPALLYYLLRHRADLRMPMMGALGACLVALCSPICGRLLGYALFPVLATPLVLWYMERTGNPTASSARWGAD